MKMMNLFAASCAATLLTLGAASAATFTFTATLDAAQANPGPGNTGASGTATLVADDVAETISFDMAVSGIGIDDLLDISTVGPVHIHEATRGNNGPVSVPFRKEDGGYRGDTSGFTILRSMVSFDSINISGDTFADFLDGLKAQEYYINVHTNDFGSGAIRGQLSAVPLPASALLLLGGLGGLGAMRRKKAA